MLAARLLGVDLQDTSLVKPAFQALQQAISRGFIQGWRLGDIKQQPYFGRSPVGVLPAGTATRRKAELEFRQRDANIFVDGYDLRN